MKHTKKITILHSNDMHGDFLAEQLDNKLVGGVSMLSGYVEKVRSEEKNVLYAIAGDMFRGSVIDSEYVQEHEWLDHWLDGRITVTL